MAHFNSAEVETKFATYPPAIRRQLLSVRSLIYDAALELGVRDELEESLKWGEPSYRIKKGSTLRMDWKASSPDQFCVYFHCQTKLIDTFKELYRDRFTYDGNRALVFSVSETIPDVELKHCISLSLNYHRVKHLPLLGA